MPGRTIHAVLIMHSSRSDNLGVGALSVAEVAILRDLAGHTGQELRITVVDFKDARASYVEGDDIEVVDLDRRFMVDPRGFFALARQADLVIDIGGGDSFADIYGSARLNRMFALKALTHLSGTPLVLAPQTIGPFHRGASRRMARATLRRSAIVSTRDNLSTEAARELGYDGEIVEASDVALRLPFDRPEPRSEGARPRVGLNVSGLLMAGGYTGNNELGIGLDYPDLVRRLIAGFEKKGAEVHLVPHVIVRSGRMVSEDDHRASEALASEFPNAVLAPAFASPGEAKSYIAGTDFFLGARMHSCIAAFSAGVPVVPMAYSRKFEGLFGSVGYDRTVDCKTESSEAILDKIDAAWRDREAVAVEVRKARELALGKLARYEMALQGLLEQVAARAR